jgi:hypothetical protein
MHSSNPARFGIFDALLVAVILALGLVNLPVPFFGDQALFTIGAAKISHGAVLYRDFWDLKQPGIYAFYLVAGKLFGFTELGIHTFELLYLAAFTVVLIVALKRYYQHPWVARLVPVMSIGVYYGVTGSWHLTQVEALVGFPLFLSLWFASHPRDEASRSWHFFLSGLMGGVVLFFKLMFILILAGFWITGAVDALVGGKERPRSVLTRLVLPTLLGVLCPVAVTILYFAHVDALDLLYKTTIEYPPRILNELPRGNLGAFVFGFLWSVERFAPLLSLALIGAYLSWPRRRDAVTTNLVLWVVLGFVVILMQRRSGWAYQYFSLVVPLGCLAGLGLDVLWGHVDMLNPLVSRRKAQILLVVAVLLTFSPIMASYCRKSIWLVYYRYGPGASKPLAYEARFEQDYPRMANEVAFLAEPGSLTGDIFVCGSPIYHYLSGRGQAVALNGWALGLYLPEQWLELREELERVRPPYIFVFPDYAELMPQRSPETMRFIEQNYRVLRTSDLGTWYIRNEIQVRPPAKSM